MNRRRQLLANNPLLAGPSLRDRKNTPAKLTPYRTIELNLIDSDPDQPRREFNSDKLQDLADSIRQYGILTPPYVKFNSLTNRYTIIAGERRFRASQLLGLTSIPVIIREDSEDEESSDVLSIQLVENLQREDLNPLEKAQALKSLKDLYNLSVRDIARKVSISKSQVQRSFDILKLPEDLLIALKKGAPESKVLLIAQIQDPDIRARYLQDIELLSRDELKKDISSTYKSKSSRSDLSNKKAMYSNPEDIRISDELQRELGLKVKLTRSSPDAESGKVIIEFYSEEDLQEIFRKLVSS